jgi:hypothetical protein
MLDLFSGYRIFFGDVWAILRRPGPRSKVADGTNLWAFSGQWFLVRHGPWFVTLWGDNMLQYPETKHFPPGLWMILNGQWACFILAFDDRNCGILDNLPRINQSIE